MQQLAQSVMIGLKESVKPRLYQQVLAASALKQHTLITLPTGLGKTLISLMMAIQRLREFPNSKILILAPTRPLVNQHLKTFEELSTLTADEMAVFTGQVSPKERAEQFNQVKIIFSTPQGLENDILSSRIHLKDISLIVFDEAHRATGEYSYVWVAKQYVAQSKNPLILGLTASPGTDVESILEVCTNLGIKHIDYRELSSPDVEPYVQKTTTQFVEVDLPESMKDIHKLLQKSYDNSISQLKNHGFMQKAPSKSELLMLVGTLQRKMSEGFDPAVATCISIAASALKISHAIELVESQGVEPLKTYMTQLFEQARQKKTKAVVALCNDPNVRVAYVRIKELSMNETEHPKMKQIMKVVASTLAQKSDAKILIFSQYRDTLGAIKEKIDQLPSVRSAIFVGQAKKNGSGMSQKKQIETIEAFSNNEFNVLCMSSVGEEGLDIPSVDLVVFFEPISSAIRSIQRRGRTGRHEEGKVIVLCTRGTRDVAYRWIAHRKEKNMYDILERVKTMLKPKKVTLGDFTASKVVAVESESHSQDSPITSLHKKSQPVIYSTSQSTISEQKLVTIYADHREKASPTLKTLFSLSVQLKLEQLAVGDYVLSKDVTVEFKRVPDFVDSLLDGRLLQQIKILKDSVLKPLIIVEGEESLFTVRQVHANAINGMLATITVSYGIPILFTRNEVETANLLFLIARREQFGSTSSFAPHASNKPVNEQEQLEYIVSALPNVGISLAQKLLKEFKTIANIANASFEELQSVDGVGKQKAETIHTILRTTYKQ